MESNDSLKNEETSIDLNISNQFVQCSFPWITNDLLFTPL